MNTPRYTDITVLLDRSGSMQSIQKPTESGFDEFIQTHKENPATRVTLIQFDSHDKEEITYAGLPVTNVPKLGMTPRGMTPYYDALCLAIDRTGRRLAGMSADARPAAVLFVIMTDGEENASHEFAAKDCRERIARQERDYAWQFVYLGANQDALKEAEKTGFDLKKAVTYGATVSGTHSVLRAMAMNTANYVSTVSGGGGASASAAVLDFSAQQRLASAGDDETLKKKAIDDAAKADATTTTLANAA